MARITPPKVTKLKLSKSIVEAIAYEIAQSEQQRRNRIIAIKNHKLESNQVKTAIQIAKEIKKCSKETLLIVEDIFTNKSGKCKNGGLIENIQNYLFNKVKISNSYVRASDVSPKVWLASVNATSIEEIKTTVRKQLSDESFALELESEE